MSAARPTLKGNDAPFNCPDCGAHDYGLYAGTLGCCPHCAKRDAARYRWLRDEGFTRPAKMWVIGQRDMIPIVHTDLDAAIDAAIREGTNEG